MIGPGTGIAPFRSFLHERRALGHTGRNWLFFGERAPRPTFSIATNFSPCTPTVISPASTSPSPAIRSRKIYVQDRMLEQAQTFWQWLQDGASIYVCGDASRMAKDVDATLHTIVEQQGQFDTEAATEYVRNSKTSTAITATSTRSHSSHTREP